jgi:glycosyltransferase involved in cell wall biosynthesis
MMTTANEEGLGPETDASSRKAPCVSIGLAVYNGARYLEDAIESLLRQTFTDFELIIADNASTDRTQEICEQFAQRDKRIRYFRHPKNIGINANFNFVHEVARGEFLKWAAHDDISSPTHVERCVEPLRRDPSVIWCQSECAPIDESGKLLPRQEWTSESVSRALASPQPHRRFHGILLGRQFCLDTYGVIRLDALRRTRGLLPFWGPEKVLFSELSLMGRYVQVPETLFFYRLHPDASSAIPSVVEQELAAVPNSKRRRIYPRLDLLKGFAGAVMRAPVGPYTRMRCLISLVAYMLQVKKWPNVVRAAMAGRGIGGRVKRQPLNEPELIPHGPDASGSRREH